MKSKVESTIRIQSHGETNPLQPPAKSVDEVSSRQNKSPKKVAHAGAGLVTPSGSRIPPAWTEVWTTTDPRSPVQATGRDSKGRRVYLYSTEHMGRAAAAKFSRLKEFSKAYPSLVRKVRRDMPTSEAALILYLISKTGFRIGSDSETLAAVKAFGASTLRCSHVTVEDNKLSFDFIGKKGIRVSKVLKDTFLAENIANRCSGTADQKIFQTTDDAIRAYLNSIPAGSRFTVKDFRTYLGTLTAFRRVQTMPVPRNDREFKKYRKEVGQIVARELGNSPTIALKSYVSPEVFCSWESGSAVPEKQAGGKRSSLTAAFLECIHYDRNVPMEECTDSDPLEQQE
jgi:DNA topoisomerase I